MLLERIILYLLLPARVATDSSGLSSAVGFLTLAILAGWFVLIARIPWGAVRKVLPLAVLCALGYLFVAKFHGEFVYPVRGLIRYGTYALLFFLFARSKISLGEIYRLFSLLVAFEMTVCLVQKIALGIERPSGTMIHSNHLTYFFAFFLALSLLHYRRSIVSAIVFGFQLMLGGMGGTLVSMMVFFFHFRQRFRAIGYLAIGLIAAITVFVMQDRFLEVGASFQDLGARLDSSNPGATSSIVWRIVTWHNMVREMLNLGGGWQGLGLEYASVVSPYFSTASHLDPHNDYVRIFLETGVFGLAIFLLGTGSLMLWLRRIENKVPFARTMKLAMAGLLVAMIVGNVVTQSTLMWLVAIFLGKVYQLSEITRKDVDGCPSPAPASL